MELLDSSWDVSICCPGCHWGITMRENISPWLYAYRAFGCLRDTSWSNSLVWWQFTGRLNKKPARGPRATGSLSGDVASYRIAWAGALQTAAWKINLLTPQTELTHPPCLGASLRTPLISCPPFLSHSLFLPQPFFPSPCMLSAQLALFRSIAEPALRIFVFKDNSCLFHVEHRQLFIDWQT